MLLDIITGLTAIAAIVIAALSYGRAMAGQLPVVELFPNPDDYTRSDYVIRIDNPTRHTLYLYHIDVKKPKAAHVYIRPPLEKPAGDIKRTLEDLSRPPTSRCRAIYLRIPPNESRQLEVGCQDDPLKPIHFRLHWSTALPWPDRFFIRGNIRASSAQLKRMRMASDSQFCCGACGAEKGIVPLRLRATWRGHGAQRPCGFQRQRLGLGVAA